MKTLFFEGAGMENTVNNELNNCRIRTAFINDNGRKIYLELTGREKTKRDNIDRLKKINIGEYIGYIDFAFYIDTESESPCNECSIKIDGDINEKYIYRYDKENILKLVNNKFNCSFNNIIVLNYLSGYRVHRENKQYNLMENYNYKPSLIEKREDIYSHFYQLEKEEGKQYPNFSLWVDEENENELHLLRHFEGYNKHWLITIEGDNWTQKETVLGKYAC